MSEAKYMKSQRDLTLNSPELFHNDSLMDLENDIKEDLKVQGQNKLV